MPYNGPSPSALVSAIAAATAANMWNPALTASTVDLIDAAIAGKTGTADELRLFDTENYAGSSYVRNAGCWAAAYASALTGVSVGNSRYSGLGGGIFLDTPDRDIVLITHHGFYETMAGQTMRFVAADNTVVNVTVAEDVRVGVLDIRVLQLTAAMPGSISPVKLLQDAPGLVVNGTDFPLIFLDQNKNALISEHPNLFSESGATTLAQGGASPRSLFWQTPIPGDSGQPVLMATAGGLACMGHLYTPTSAVGYLGANKVAIASAIASTGSNDAIATQTI